MPNGKVTTIHLIVGLIKRYYCIKKSSFAPYGHSKNKIEVELDFSNYATKANLKSGTGVDTLQFSKKDDLDDLKWEVD